MNNDLRKIPLGNHYCKIVDRLYSSVYNDKFSVETELLSGTIYLVKSPVTPGEYKIEYVGEKISISFRKINLVLQGPPYRIDQNLQYDRDFIDRKVHSKMLYQIFKEIISRHPQLLVN